MSQSQAPVPSPPGRADSGPSAIREVARTRSIIICCGSGGVGKTTTAAAVALEAARLGRKACVVTIDPARRLANSLGLDALSNQPTRIDGPWSGQLHALMLDSKGTFDDLVKRYSDSAKQAEDIKVNRIYRNLTGSLSGTQEYMAMEKLYELVEEGGFDVVVVDTPPTRNALDFLDAPRRLTHFLENRLFQALMKPTRVGLKIMGVAAQALLRTISKVAGADIVADAVAFFQAFEGMEEGFRDRAARVRELLVQSDTAFILVASPRSDSVDEAVHFAGKLAESEMSVTALVVNRVQPRFASDAQLATVPALDASGPTADLAQLVENLQGYTAASDREEQAFAALVSKVKPAPVYRVPLLNSDVHDLEGLAHIADLLFGGGGASEAGGAPAALDAPGSAGTGSAGTGSAGVGTGTAETGTAGTGTGASASVGGAP
ncbi:MAG: ArsA family ATPase [Acidimicrobiales bacterium]